MDVFTRALEQSDLERCAALFVSVFNRPPWRDRWVVGSAYGRLCDIVNSPGSLGLVAVSDGELVGFACGCCEQWFDGQHFYLREMCVASDLQRKGIGSRMLADLEQKLRQTGISQTYLLTREGEPAEAFYTRNGYRTSSRTVLMSKRLP